MTEYSHYAKEVEFYEFLGRHPARASKIALKMHIHTGEPRTLFSEHYRKTAATIKTLSEGIHRRGQQKSGK